MQGPPLLPACRSSLDTLIPTIPARGESHTYVFIYVIGGPFNPHTQNAPHPLNPKPHPPHKTLPNESTPYIYMCMLDPLNINSRWLTRRTREFSYTRSWL
jgi:hypothetical protein